jgi:hypothetical protein
LTVNKSLRELHLGDVLLGRDHVDTKASLDAKAYEAISAMLRVNTSLVLKMRIEQRLNQVGRGNLLLSSCQTTREECVWALHDLNTFNVNESPAYQVSCLYSLLRSDPSVVQSSVLHVRPLRRRAYSI